MDDLISREETLTAFADYVGSGMSMNDYDALWDIVAKMPSVNPQADKEDIHREREQAYMEGYEDASKRYRTEPCGDAISRQEVLEVLARIAKAKARSDAQKSMMGRTMFFVERLPSVSTEKTGWIPVSERFPEDGTYLICTDDGYIATIMYDRSMGWLLNSNIIAWMPLPQPYTAESEEA